MQIRKIGQKFDCGISGKAGFQTSHWCFHHDLLCEFASHEIHQVQRCTAKCQCHKHLESLQTFTNELANTWQSCSHFQTNLQFSGTFANVAITCKQVLTKCNAKIQMVRQFVDVWQCLQMFHNFAHVCKEIHKRSAVS